MVLRVGRSRLPEWFRKSKKKQVDLARHLKVSRAYVSMVCHDKEQLTIVNMKMTADFFGICMDDTVEWIHEPD